MKTASRTSTGFLLLLVLVIGVALGLLIARPLLHSGDDAAKESVDPHEGQVYIYDGVDWVWMTPLEGVPVNAFTKEDFSLSGETPYYLGTGYETLLGVDVAEHQYEVDWQQVKNAGYDFAFIRIGRRGYTEGGLFNDPWFEKNYQGAKENGLLVGVYFYSQAISEEEAREEAAFVLDRLNQRELDLPIVFDLERVENEDAEFARTRDLDMETRTDCALRFCQEVEENGYSAAIYFNRTVGYYGYDLSRLTDYPFWFALYLNPPELFWPSFYYKVDYWQYHDQATVPGIEGPVDVNMIFRPIPEPNPEPTAAEGDA